MEKNEINKIVTEIKDVIEAMRFYINQDGGDLEFVECNPDNGEVVIKLLGQCVGCALIDVTYKDGLETILKNEVKGVCSVRVIE